MNPKAKGSAFERLTCKHLSLWVSGGTDKDLFWRSAISGGRATVGLRKGEVLRAAGDICSISPSGHDLTDHFYIECKHRQELNLGRMLFGTGYLAQTWEHTVKQAVINKKAPILIAKQNLYPTLMLLLPHSHNEGSHLWHKIGPRIPQPIARVGTASIFLFDDMMRATWKGGTHVKTMPDTRM